jgi:hypothetical protein
MSFTAMSFTAVSTEMTSHSNSAVNDMFKYTGVRIKFDPRTSV